MYCPKCGSPIDTDHSFCSHCGCSLDEWGGGSQYHHESPTGQPKKSQPLWFYIIVVLAFSLMIWGLYSFITGVDTLSGIAKLQLDEIKTNKLTKAYYEHTSSEFRKENTLEEFKSFIEENQALKSYLSIDIVKSEKDKKYGVVFLKLLLPGELIAKVKFEFVEEEGEWRILGISMEKPTASQQDNEEVDSSIIDAVKAHLAALRKGELDKAYAMGSKEFLEATEFQGFKDFVQEHPALATDKAVNMSIVEQEGDKSLVRAILYSNGQPVPIDYIMVPEDGNWKVWSFYVLTPSNDEQDQEEDNVLNEDVSAPIDAFLQDLRNSQIEDAYDKTSEKFRKTTSLDQFREFLKQFAILTEGMGAPVKSKVSGDVGQVRYKIHSDDQEATVDYILTKENGSWKILGIQLVDDFVPVDEELQAEENTDFDSSFLTKTISDQLQQIKQKDLYSAYEDYTSEKFRESTPFEDFARFVEQNAVFSKNSSIEFGELTFNNNIATIFVDLKSGDDLHEQVEYDLVKEGDEWKVLSIKIIATQSSNVESKENPHNDNGVVIEGIDVGTEVNLSGQITNPSTKIKSTASEIFATLFINEGKTGTVIEVFFQHLDTGSSLPPVTKTLKDKGNTPISLVFTPPKGGWPVGKYMLKAKASTGQEKDFEFEVIE